MIVDAHHHCWQLSRAENQWPTPDLTALYRDFGPKDFREEADRLGVSGAILVQSQEDVRDTYYLLALAAREPKVLGVVGWLNLAEDHSAAAVAELAQQPLLKGLRPMLQSLPEDDWVLRRARADGLEAMVRHHLVFDALVYPRHLPVVTELSRRYPGLRIVLDHAGKPDIASGQFEPWHQALGVLASQPNVYCKLSGLVTEMATGQPWHELSVYIDTVLALFGPDRVLWGSDWPVVNLAGGYERWLSIARERVVAQCPGAAEDVFANTARRVYRLGH